MPIPLWQFSSSSACMSSSSLGQVFPKKWKTSFDEKLTFWRLHTGYDSKCFFIETEVMGQVPKHTFLMYQHFKQCDIFFKNWIDGIINHNLAFHVWITILNSNLKIPEILFVVKIIEEICDDFGIRIFNWSIHILKTDISVESCRGYSVHYYINRYLLVWRIIQLLLPLMPVIMNRHQSS